MYAIRSYYENSALNLTGLHQITQLVNLQQIGRSRPGDGAAHGDHDDVTRLQSLRSQHGGRDTLDLGFGIPLDINLKGLNPGIKRQLPGNHRRRCDRQNRIV